MRVNKAKILFSLLPPDTSKQIEPYLTNLEIAKLTEFKKKNREKLSQNIPLATLTEISEHLQKSQRNLKPSYIYFGYFLINLFLALLFLFQGERASSLTVLIYAFSGAFIVSRKSKTFWKFQLSPSKISSSEIFFLCLAYAFMTLVLGLYNIGTINANIKVSYLLQAFIFGPLFEELLFRGFLIEVFTLRYIKIEWSLIISWVLSSFFFATVHLQNFGQDFLMSLLIFSMAGLALCMTKWHLKKIFYSWLLHALVNLTIFLL